MRETASKELDDTGRDWAQTIIHFVCGVIGGGLVGLGFGVYAFDGTGAVVLTVLGSAIVTGLAAAWLGDDFWNTWLAHLAWW